jgi:hypothetical protein
VLIITGYIYTTDCPPPTGQDGRRIVARATNIALLLSSRSAQEPFPRSKAVAVPSSPPTSSAEVTSAASYNPLPQMPSDVLGENYALPTDTRTLTVYTNTTMSRSAEHCHCYNTNGLMLRSSGFAPCERTGYCLIAHDDTTTSLWAPVFVPSHFPLSSR